MSHQAVVLLSAGLDSTTSLALARSEGVEIKYGLAFDYGQRAVEAEWRQAQKIALHYGLEVQRLSLPWLAQLNDSALGAESTEELPRVDIAALDQVMGTTLQSAARVWVPNRNGLFIHIAAVWADRYGLTEIITGFNAEEAVTFPDNTPQFAEAMTRGLAFSTRSQPRVHSYVQHLNKIEILQAALEHEVPLSLLWSCYDGGDVHCGQCESCNRLKRALIACEQQIVLNTLFGASYA